MRAEYTEHVYQEYHYKGYEPIHQLEEIVRCKDCREYNPELYKHITCEMLGRYVEPDGFCAWGERK